jgi:DnaK suppressor protein
LFTLLWVKAHCQMASLSGRDMGADVSGIHIHQLVQITVIFYFVVKVRLVWFARADYKPAQTGRFWHMNQMLRANDTSYQPADGEPFMSERQKAYFKSKLLAWKADILREARETLDALAQENTNHPDLADRASSETDRSIELRARDRQRKLISKIDSALERIEEGTYGYCEETGEPISLKRLDARPVATLSIEAQERHERREKVYRDE